MSAAATETAPQRPGPRGSWLTGHLTAFGKDPLGFLERSARDHGDFVPIRFFRKPALIINATSAIEEVLTTQQSNFTKARGNGNPFADSIFGNGLLTSEGATWSRQRRLVQPAFHRKRVAGYADQVVEMTEAMIARWKDGATVPVHRELVQLTTRVISKAFFGVEVPRALIELDEASQAIMETMSSPRSVWGLLAALLPNPANRRIKAVLEGLNRFLYDLIAQRREEKKDHGDILSLLIDARDDQGQGMTDRELRDELATLLVAGLDTTVLALSWSCYLLARHPGAADALEMELGRVLGRRMPTFDDLPSLHYTEAVIKESMRLFPPAWIMVREPIEDCVVGGHPVRRGTTVILSQWLKHRDARLFEKPDEFRPQRWIEEPEIPRFAYFPFGGGPRICIGKAFAMMEAPLALGTICRKFRFHCDPDYRVEPWPSLTLQPRGGIHLRVDAVGHPDRTSLSKDATPDATG